MNNYPIYELKLKPLSPWISDLTADTIFGHLCWQIKYEKWEDVLVSFLEEMIDNPIFTISDILPADRLPRPLTKFDGDLWDKAKRDYVRNKRYKTVDRVNINKFKQHFLWKELNLDNIKQAKVDIGKDKVKYFVTNIENNNIIDRNTGTTWEWWIYSQESIISTWVVLSLFIKLFNKEKFENLWIIDLLRNIFEIQGFGKKKSTGKWLFKIEAINKNFKEEFYENWTSDCKNILLLSSFVPSEKDTKNWNYKIFTKFPKMWEEFSMEWTNFYKKPLVIIEKWATFINNNKWYIGGMIENMDFNNKWVCHYGYWFTLEF